MWAHGIGATLSTLAVSAIVGHSSAGRPIELVHVPGPGPRVLVVGCIHGDECAGMAVVRALRRSHPRADLWLVPTLNPDGLARGTRQNARGIDLNRNFPSGWRPFGPPWSVYSAGRPALVGAGDARRARPGRARPPAVHVWFHQHLDLVWAYGRSSAAGRRYARLSGSVPPPSVARGHRDELAEPPARRRREHHGRAAGGPARCRGRSDARSGQCLRGDTCAGCAGTSHGVCGSPSQQPSLNAQRGHCQVPCTPLHRRRAAPAHLGLGHG